MIEVEVQITDGGHRINADVLEEVMQRYFDKYQLRSAFLSDAMRMLAWEIWGIIEDTEKIPKDAQAGDNPAQSR